MNTLMIWWTLAMWVVGSVVVTAAIGILALIVLNAIMTKSLKRECRILRHNIWVYKAMTAYAKEHKRPGGDEGVEAKDQVRRAAHMLRGMANDEGLIVNINMEQYDKRMGASYMRCEVRDSHETYRKAENET